MQNSVRKILQENVIKLFKLSTFRVIQIIQRFFLMKNGKVTEFTMKEYFLPTEFFRAFFAEIFLCAILSSKPSVSTNFDRFKY